MRKWLLMLMSLLLLAAPALAEDALLEDCTVQLAQDLPAIMDNAAYTEIYLPAVFKEAVADQFGQYSAYTWEKPLFDVYLSVDRAALESMLGEQGITVTEDTRTRMQQLLPTMMCSLMQTYSDEYDVLLSNLLQCTRFYADPARPDGTMAFIRFFEDGMPLLYLVDAQDGAVLAGVNALLHAEELAACQNAQDVQRWMDANGKKVLVASDEPVLMQLTQAECAGSTMSERALGLVPELLAAMNDEAYSQLLGLGESAPNVLQGWAAGDYARPRLMAQAELNLEAHGAMLLGNNGTLPLADGDSAVARSLRQMLAGTAYSQLLIQQIDDGYQTLSIATSITAMARYADPQQPDGTGMYILLYDGGHAIWVSWYAENGVVVLNASYLPAEDVAECQSVAELTTKLTALGLPVEMTGVAID